MSTQFTERSERKLLCELKDLLNLMVEKKASDLHITPEQTKEIDFMNKKGLSFIEIIVSVLVIAALAAGIFGAFAGTQQFLNRSRHRLQAFNFAREALDRLRSSSNYQYTASPQMDAGSHPASDIGISIEGEMVSLVANPSTDFKYDVTAEPEIGSYKTVTVTVKWDERTL